MSFKPLSDSHKEKYIKIGLNITYYRKQKGMSQLELAEKAGISRSFMSAIEAPRMPIGISLESLFDIAKALEIDPYKLLMFRE